jgi:hypothetical protein
MPGVLGAADGGRSPHPKSARISAVSDGLGRSFGSESRCCSASAEETEAMVDSRWAV